MAERWKQEDGKKTGMTKKNDGKKEKLVQESVYNVNS